MNALEKYLAKVKLAAAFSKHAQSNMASGPQKRIIRNKRQGVGSDEAVRAFKQGKIPARDRSPSTRTHGGGPFSLNSMPIAGELSRMGAHLGNPDISPYRKARTTRSTDLGGKRPGFIVYPDKGRK